MDAIFSADNNSFTPEELQYNLTSTILFTNVSEDRFQTGLYPAFRDLLSKFNPRIGQSDPDLTNETKLFLDRVLETRPMYEAYKCLVNTKWGHVYDELDFRHKLKQYWFTKFSRSNGVANDSSGFEYVFQGEITEDGNKTTGFHSWVNVYDNQQSGTLVYGGSRAECLDGLVRINNYTFHNASGDGATIWIGRSLELQFAVYTVCFLTRRNVNCKFKVKVDGRTKYMKVATKQIKINGKDTIDRIHPICHPRRRTLKHPSFNKVKLSSCTEAIWGNDTNSFMEQEIKYNLSGPVLFTYVNESRFNTGMYPLYLGLLNKYNQRLGEPDLALANETSVFIDAVLDTGPMKVAMQCLVEFGIMTNETDFHETIRQYWFEKYSRSSGTVLDSSGFEHVFMGEVRENGRELTGWHGWVHVYKMEQQGNLTYGTSQRDCGNGLIQVNNYHYDYAKKPISSIWIGKSPELELALYTVCFAVNRNRNCDFTVDGGRPVQVVSHSMSGSNRIGTIYPLC